MDTFFQDIRYAVRSLTKARGFALVAILTLGLGIGMNAAIYSIVDAVLIKPLSFREPDRLVRLTADFEKRGITDIGLGPVELADYRARTDLFESVAGIYAINVNLTDVDEPERIEGQLVSGNYFDVLGVTASVGQVFHQSDEIPGNAELVVISDGLWRRRFGADPLVIGRRIRLDNDFYTVVGVLPASFHHPGRNLQEEPDIYGPTGYSATPFPKPARGLPILGGAIARLKPGVSVEQASQRIDALGAALRAQNREAYPDSQGWRPRVLPLQADLVGSVESGLYVLVAAVGAVLLIACVNVAGLLLARATVRQREFAVRGAMGASRLRLIRQVLTESVVLSIAGGALGVFSARWLVSALVALIPAGMPRATEIAVNGRVLWFSLAVSVVTGLVFGLWPALQASPVAPSDSLKDSARSMQSSRERTFARRVLVVAEFALALMLLVTAALFVRSFVQLYSVDPGFRSAGVMTAQLWMPIPNDPSTGPYTSHAQRLPFFRESLNRIRALPGVEQAAWVTRLPLSGGRAGSLFLVEGRPVESATVSTVEPILATPTYFDTLGIPLVRGRTLSDDDHATAPPVIVVNNAFAKKYFPGEDPIGRRIRPGGPASTAPWFTIVGIVGDVRTTALDTTPTPQLYRSVWQASSLSMALVVRVTRDPAGISRAVVESIHSIDRELPLFAMQPMDSVLHASTAERRFAMIVVSVFASLALVLSAIGIYGVLSYIVHQRTSEIGLRMALGAEAGSVLRLVLGEGLVLAGSGIAIGLAGAWLVGQAVAGMLFGVGPMDPVSFVGISLLLTVVAVAACAVPAIRAMRIDPLVALRH